SMPLATIRLDRDALARYDLDVHEVSQTIETAFYGHVVSRVLDNPYAFDLVVRYPDAVRDNLETIKQTMVPTPGGAWVPLEVLADIQRNRGPNQISRENGQRKIVVMCNVGEGAALGTVVDAIRERVDAYVSLPEGYYIEYGGQFEAAQAAANTLVWLGIIVVLGIFLLLYVALQSIRDALLVMMNLPL